jgi:hypothetical protein
VTARTRVGRLCGCTIWGCFLWRPQNHTNMPILGLSNSEPPNPPCVNTEYHLQSVYTLVRCGVQVEHQVHCDGKEIDGKTDCKDLKGVQIMLSDENPGSRGSMCSLGVMFGGTLFAVLFGGLGYVLCDGFDRCWPQCFGQVVRPEISTRGRC